MAKNGLFKKIVVSFLLLLICSASATYAQEQIYLINGDRISGIIAQKQEDAILLDTSFFGTLLIDRANIEKIISEEEAIPEEIKVEWKREVETGYNLVTGNTERSNFIVAGLINRKTDRHEITLKGNFNYTSSDEKMDGQTWYTMARYAYSFGKARKWFNFYKFEADHDKFANIDYRLIPSTGIGYWFFNQDPFKAEADIGVGYEYTEYNDDTDNSETVTVIPHAYAEWNIYKDMRLSEDITVYPTLDDFGEYRLISTTIFTNPITDKLAFRVSYINKYNSDPADDAEKHDMELNSSLAYKF